MFSTLAYFIVEKDLQLIWYIQDFFHRSERWDTIFKSIISTNPLQDIVIVLFPFFCISIMDFPQEHFWVISVNLILTFLLRNILQIRRPYQYDNRLLPLTDTSTDSHGFPSLESHMSVVILGHLLYHKYSFLFLCVAIFIIGLVGFSRIYSRSRFIYQILLSWFSGAFGLAVTLHVYHIYDMKKISKYTQGCYIGILVVIFICYLSLAAEDNESRIIHIKKTEFVRVIAGIMNSTVDGSENTNNNTNSSSTPAPKYSSPRADAARRSLSKSLLTNKSTDRNPKDRKDSFFFLQRSLERRERKLLERSPKTGSKYSPEVRGNVRFKSYGSTYSPRDSDGSAGMDEGEDKT